MDVLRRHRLIQRLAVHVSHHQHGAIPPVLNDRRHETPLVEMDLPPPIHDTTTECATRQSGNLIGMPFSCRNLFAWPIV